jgi:thiol-disulfide isomerase/thioredoxin
MTPIIKRNILAYSLIVLGFGFAITFGYLDLNGLLPGSSVKSAREYQGQGFPIPDLEVSLIDGSEFNSLDHLGTPLVLNFWATWCAPCRLEMPLFEEIEQENRSSFNLLAINFDESEEQIKAYQQELRQFRKCLE